MSDGKKSGRAFIEKLKDDRRFKDVKPSNDGGEFTRFSREAKAAIEAGMKRAAQEPK